MPKRKKSGGNYTSKGERRNVNKSILKAVRRDRTVMDRMLDKQEAGLKRWEIIEKDIPIVERPKGLSLTSPYFHVVTSENLEEFIEKFKKSNGSELVFYAISVRDYENLSLNLAELRRYIEQQQAIIVYYETAIEGDDDVIQDSSDN